MIILLNLKIFLPHSHNEAHKTREYEAIKMLPHTLSHLSSTELTS